MQKMKLMMGAAISAMMGGMSGFNHAPSHKFFAPSPRVGPKDDSGAGMRRASKRLNEHMKQWDNTPKSTTVSRQVRRHKERKGYQAVMTA